MVPLLDRRLVFVTGKGGVGKTTVAAALGLLAASLGKRTLVAEVDAKGNLADFFEVPSTSFEPREVAPNLSVMTMHTEDSLKEYLKLQLKLPLVARLGPLARTFDFVANAAPGVKEVLVVGKFLWEVRQKSYDIVIVDAVATGHIIAQLAAPQALRELVKVGLVREQTGWMLELLGDPAVTGAAIVASPEEMPVNETIELAGRIDAETNVELAAVIVNRVLPELFGRSEEEVFERLRKPKPAAALEAAVGAPGRARARRRRAGRAPAAHPRRAPHPPARGHRPVGRAALRARALHPPARHPRHPPGRRRAPRGAPLMAARPRTRAAAAQAAPSLERLFAAKEIVIHCGSGGVGKTTTAAAAAAEAAVHLGGKVLVLTVDPAKRLANALGIEQFGNVETRVPAEAFAAAGVEPRGELWAAMLDTKQSWDDLIHRHAPDEATRDAILANPLYQNLMGRFVQSHDYIAMERLYDLHSSGTYDLIVVDTPPTRNAIDFLEAPARMADFFSSRLLRWLTAPARSRVVNLASKPFYTVADRILGTQFLQDIAEFFLLFQSMYDGFVERAEAVERILQDRRTTFVVVSTLESAPVREAEFFVQELAEAQAPPRRPRVQQGAAGVAARPRRRHRRQGAGAVPGGRRRGGGTVGARRGGPGGPRAARGRRQLPELPGGRPARGRDPRRAGPHPRRRRHGALPRPGRHRPRRSPTARRPHLALRGDYHAVGRTTYTGRASVDDRQRGGASDNGAVQQEAADAARHRPP